MREVRITETPAARHDAWMLGAPAVKLIIAGTRPIACSAKNVTATPTEFGSITPTAPPGGSERRELGAQHLRRQDQLAVAELDAERIGDRRPAGVAGLVRVGQGLKQRAVDAAPSRRPPRP